MSVLDELRKQIGPGGETWASEDVLAEIDAFEAAHPGLVDYTARCLVCRKPINPATSPGVNNAITGEYIGDICPDCAHAGAVQP